MINDDFFATFFNMFNLMVVQIISVIRLMTGEFHERDEYPILSGIEVLENTKKENRQVKFLN